MNSNRFGIAFILLAGIAGAALAEDGVTDKTIIFGQVAALTGPAQDLGQGMRQGILAAFEDANRGGILGMPGVLAVTSYPERTSAVKRGRDSARKRTSSAASAA